MYSQECLQEDEEEGIALVAEVHPSSRQDFASTETSAPASADQCQSLPPTLFPASSLLLARPTKFHPNVTMEIKGM